MSLAVPELWCIDVSEQTEMRSITRNLFLENDVAGRLDHVTVCHTDMGGSRWQGASHEGCEGGIEGGIERETFAREIRRGQKPAPNSTCAELRTDDRLATGADRTATFGDRKRQNRQKSGYRREAGRGVLPGRRLPAFPGDPLKGTTGDKLMAICDQTEASVIPAGAPVETGSPDWKALETTTLGDRTRQLAKFSYPFARIRGDSPVGSLIWLSGAVASRWTRNALPWKVEMDAGSVRNVALVVARIDIN